MVLLKLSQVLSLLCSKHSNEFPSYSTGADALHCWLTLIMLSSLLWLLCSLLLLFQPHWHLLSLKHATDLTGLPNFYLYASDLTSFLSWCPGLSHLFLAYVAINTLALGHWAWNDTLKQIPVLEFWLLLLLNSPLRPPSPPPPPPLFFFYFARIYFSLLPIQPFI